MFSVEKVSSNKININIIKGNTFREYIKIQNDERLSYMPCVGDRLYFLVYNKYTDETPIFEKRIPYDTLLLELKAKETASFKIGTYVYKIRLKKINGDVDDFLFGSLSIQGGA